MVGTVKKYGRPVTGPEVDIGWFDGYQRSCVYDAHSDVVIVYALGGWLGEQAGGTPYARLVMGDVNTGDVPGDILAQTAEFQPSAAYSDITGGDDYELNVTPFVHAANQRFSLALLSRNGTVSHSMRAAASITASNRNFYDKVRGATTVPTNPLGGTPSYEGHMSLWFVSEPSVAPNAPTNLTPSGSSASTDLTPTLTSSFSDANETLNNGVAYDYLYQFQILVIRLSDNATMWDTTLTATTAERNGRYTSREYAGSALAYNTEYGYAIRHRDRDNNWGAWASTTFSITSLSSVDRPTNPAGFETNKADPGAITAVYRHNAGLNANAMRARLLSSGGYLLAVSSDKAVSVAPNGTLSMTWAESGFGAHTVNGGSYQIQVLARDTNNQWSPAWSPVQTFRFNAAPNTPSSLSPSGSAASSARPLLTCVVSDPDVEDPETDLTVKARIKNSGGTVLQTRTMTWDATLGKFKYQTTAADLAAYGTFKWDAYSFDGTLYSGGTTVEASATKSSEATFVYAAGPAVTITGPSSPVSTVVPTLTWSTTFTGGGTQVSYRVRGYHPGTSTLVYDSGTVTSTSTSHTISSGSWINEEWNNTETFDWTVTVTDSNALSGTSTPLALTVSYVAPESLTLGTFPDAFPNTSGTNYVRLEWGMSGDPDFKDYEIARVALLEDGITEKPRSRKVLAHVAEQAQTSFIDAEVESGQLYRYELRHRTEQGNDVLASSPVSANAVVEWVGTIIHAPADPMTYHLWFQLGAPAYEPKTHYGQNASLISPVGGSGRVAFFSPGQTHDHEGVFALVSRYGMSALDRFKKLYEIWQFQGGEIDDVAHTLCWREGRGGPGSVTYGVLMPDWNRAHDEGGRFIINVKFSEVAFELGVQS